MKKLVLQVYLGVIALIFSGSMLFADQQANLEVIEVDNIAALRAMAPGTETVYKITGEVVVTLFQTYRNQIFVQDATAGILIDDPNNIIATVYKVNDGITGLTGKLAIFRNNLQLLPSEDPGEATSASNTPEPVQRTLADLTQADQGRLVRIADFSFAEADHGTNFTTGKNFNISDPTGAGVFRTEFWEADYIGAVVPDTPREIVAIVIMFNATIQLASRSLADLNITDIPTIKALRNQAADNETVYTLTGEAFLSYQQTFRNKKWVQDATAGIEIDDNGKIITTIYDIGDGIVGITGKLNVNRNMLQFVPVEDPGEAQSKDNELLVVERTLATLSSDDQGRLTVIKEVSFDEGLFGTNFATGRNMNISDPSGTGVFRTEFYEVNYIGTPVPVTPQNITVIIRQYDAIFQITARSLDDFEPSGEELRYSLLFSVTDESGAELNGATITVGEETYNPGQYAIGELLPGTYSYSIALEGYHPVSGQAIIISEDVALEITLIAIDPELITGFPWTEGFEGEFPPAGWKLYDPEGSGNWVSHPTANTGSAAAHHTFTAVGQEADNWLVSPQIQLPEEETMMLNFFERNALMADYKYSGVWLSTASGVPANGQFVELHESDATAGSYTQRTLNLADYKGEIVYLAFVYRGADGHQWWIDDVKIDQAPDVIEVANIAALREQEIVATTVYRITGEVILTHKNGNRNQKYFQDATGAILVDDAAPSGSPAGTPGVITTAYNEYDAVSGLTGKISVYNQMWQLLPTADPGPPVSSNNVVEPLVITIEEMKPEYQAMLIEIKNATIAIPAGQTDFATSRSYNITDGTGTAILRTPHNNAGLDYFNTPIPTSARDIVGMFVQFNNDLQISPRSLADFKVPGGTGIGETQAGTFSVFPNPARTHFTVQHNERIEMIRVIDMNGRLLFSQTVNDSQAILSTDLLGNGLYIVQVISEGKLINQKLQISR